MVHKMIYFIVPVRGLAHLLHQQILVSQCLAFKRRVFWSSRIMWWISQWKVWNPVEMKNWRIRNPLRGLILFGICKIYLGDRSPLSTTCRYFTTTLLKWDWMLRLSQVMPSHLRGVGHWTFLTKYLFTWLCTNSLLLETCYWLQVSI